MSYHDKHSRSIVKAISYRVLSLTVDSIFVYAFTKKIDLTLAIVIVTNTYSTFLYYMHERAWNIIHYGRTIVRKRALATKTTRHKE